MALDGLQPWTKGATCCWHSPLCTVCPVAVGTVIMLNLSKAQPCSSPDHRGEEGAAGACCPVVQPRGEKGELASV